MLHFFFFLSLLIEVEVVKSSMPPYWPFLLIVFFFAQGLRYWSILSLGDRWTTRIIILPSEPRIQAGPYRFLKHPNYLAVAIELLALPMIFGAYFTAITFTILNMLMLRVRIEVEESALNSGPT